MIAILAPYDRSEMTAAAIRLADIVLGVGESVRLVSVGHRETGIHPYWDQRSRSGAGDGIYKASIGVDTFIHFQAQVKVRQMTSLIAEKAKHVIVPCWHHLRIEEAALLPDHDCIVCPSQHCFAGIKDISFNGIEPKKPVLSWARWDSGLPPILRDGLVKSGTVRALVVANRSVTDVCARVVLQSIVQTMESLPKLELTLLSNRTWKPEDRKFITRIHRKFGYRFERIISPAYGTMVSECHRHDWTIIPASRADFGLLASKALSCGTPVITYDIAPYNEIITDRHNGVLVPCGTTSNDYKAPTGTPDAPTLSRTLVTSLGDTKLLLKMQTHDWGLDGHRTEFVRYWRQLLGIFSD